MRVVIKTQSSAWEVLESEEIPKDAADALLYVGRAIDAQEPLLCQLVQGDVGERWVVFFAAGIEYVSAHDTPEPSAGPSSA